MYILISDDRVVVEKSLKKINKKFGILVEDSEFKVVGADKVAIITESNLSFVQDKKNLSNVAINKLFRKKNQNVFILIALMILNIIIMLQGCVNVGG